MALFSLEEAYCKVFENVTNVIVCAENIDGVICPVSFDFNLLFSIDSDSGQFYSLFHSLLLSVIYYTAVSYNDSDSTIVPFPSCSMRECITIPIINDDILEYGEGFAVSLERPADVDSRVELVHPTLKVVDIFDEDSMLLLAAHFVILV